MISPGAYVLLFVFTVNTPRSRYKFHVAASASLAPAKTPEEMRTKRSKDLSIPEGGMRFAAISFRRIKPRASKNSRATMLPSTVFTFQKDGLTAGVVVADCSCGLEKVRVSRTFPAASTSVIVASG